MLWWNETTIVRLQAGVGFCGASDVKALRYRATQHIHKVTLPVFSRDVRTQPNATTFFAQTKSRGKTAAFRVMILDHEDQTRPGATALARA